MSHSFIDEDTPVEGTPLAQLDGPLKLPAIVFGAGSFSNQYNTDDHLQSDIPVRTVRLALQYGIRAFDTSVYYGDSEVLLGRALQTVKDEFPRSSYQLMTKCGRFGVSDFDYSPSRIRQSVLRSLERLQTDYLDTVYLHDVEFVCTPLDSKKTGNHATALTTERVEYGLVEDEEGRIRGEGDQRILDAYAELQRLRNEGLVKHIGITGYPLPTLLRLALLILHNPPYKPVDVILSYSHLSLQNATFLKFAPQFYGRARVSQLVAASPFSMGLLTASTPAWHPAPKELKEAASRASSIWADGLPNLALGFSIRHTGGDKGNVPLVAGFSHPREVHECIRVWREVQDRKEDVARKEAEDEAQNIFNESGFLNWSWASP